MDEKGPLWRHLLVWYFIILSNPSYTSVRTEFNAHKDGGNFPQFSSPKNSLLDACFPFNPCLPYYPLLLGKLPAARQLGDVHGSPKGSNIDWIYHQSLYSVFLLQWTMGEKCYMSIEWLKYIITLKVCNTHCWRSLLVFNTHAHKMHNIFSVGGVFVE